MKDKKRYPGKLLDDKIFKPGNVTYNSFNIAFDIPFSQQEDSLNEDMVQVEYENGYVIDIGWYPEMAPKGSLIIQLIHDHDWNRGYGSLMMDHVLCDIKNAGYSDAILWVFRDNTRARAFYESKGFSFTGISKSAFDTEEVLYSIDF